MSRSRKKNVGIYIFLAIILLLGAYIYWQATPQVKEKSISDDYQKTSLDIAGNSLEAYLADSDEKQKLGLSIFKELPEDEGMLFLENNPGKPAFWMKDMKFDIDIIWIRDNKIVGITPNISHFDQNIKYYPEEDVDAILEVSAGYCRLNKIEEGDEVRW